MLVFFARRRRDIPFRRIFFLFGAFIIACGTTHFLSYYTFYRPLYRLDGLVKLITAAVSWGTVFALVPITPIVLAMRTPEELEREIRARKEAEAALQQVNDTLETRVQERTAEIEALNQRLRRAMSETHHRVKNNLQVISALVDLQTMEDAEFVPMGELERLGQHVRSLAVIHDLLTHQAKTDDRVADLEMRDTVEKLVPMLQAMMPDRQIRVNVKEMRLAIRPGTSLTILINEMVSNAGKHGRGDIEIDLTQDGERGRLSVRDHGPGFPPGFDPRKAAHTGLDLIQDLTQWDLLGRVAFENAAGGGAQIVIDFPLVTPQEPLSEVPQSP